jgi:hypothetical protein
LKFQSYEVQRFWNISMEIWKFGKIISMEVCKFGYKVEGSFKV